MNSDTIKGNWKQVQGKVKEQWGKLTDDHLTRINGQRDQLTGQIQEAYGIGRDEADKQVKDFETRNPNVLNRDGTATTLNDGTVARNTTHSTTEL